MTLTMPLLQAMSVLRSKSYSCHWFQQANEEFIYRQNSVFQDILMLACFTLALNGSCQDPVSLCCTARKRSCCQKSLKAWEYAMQGIERAAEHRRVLALAGACVTNVIPTSS